MNVFETSTTVEPEGHVHLAGVPFAPGTEVDVTISPKRPPHDRAGPAHAGVGLGWEGNVLIHRGVGAAPSVAELRNERLERLSEGLSG